MNPKLLILIGLFTGISRADILSEMVWKARMANWCIVEGNCNRTPKYHKLHADTVARAFLLEFPEQQRLIIADMLLKGQSILQISNVKRWEQAATRVRPAGLLKLQKQLPGNRQNSYWRRYER